MAKANSELKSQGFGIDNKQYSFTSLRGGGGSTVGDKSQVLLVLTSSGKAIKEIIKTKYRSLLNELNTQ